MGRAGRSFVRAWVGAVLAFAVASASAEEIRVESVEVVVSPMGPALLLRIGERAIPVFVDATVAESVQAALADRKLERPLTHNLMHAILRALEARVSQVVVTLKGTTFHGALTLVVRDSTKVFDSRSSDAIALAVHFNAPILVSRELLDSRGVDLPRAGEPRKR
jgi:bifunctional DNase/RNase